MHTLTSNSTYLSSEEDARLHQLLTRYEDIFSQTAEKLVGPTVKMHLKPGATPVFARAREIPAALRDRYAKEIDAKIASGHYTGCPG